MKAVLEWHLSTVELLFSFLVTVLWFDTLHYVIHCSPKPHKCIVFVRIVQMLNISLSFFLTYAFAPNCLFILYNHTVSCFRVLIIVVCFTVFGWMVMLENLSREGLV